MKDIHDNLISVGDWVKVHDNTWRLEKGQDFEVIYDYGNGTVRVDAPDGLMQTNNRKVGIPHSSYSAVSDRDGKGWNFSAGDRLEIINQTANITEPDESVYNDLI